MGFLTGLIPGFRELRTPLAVGYIWLATLWLAVGSHVPSLPKDSNDPAARAWVFLGTAGQVAVVTFAAYALGSASTEFRLAPTLEWLAGLIPMPKLHRPAALGSVVLLLVRALFRLERSSRPPVSVGAVKALARWFMLWRAEHHDAKLILPDTDSGTRWFVKSSLGVRDDCEAVAVVAALLANLETLRTQLLLKSPRLALEIDRRRSEGEFRHAIGWPLLALVVVVAVRNGVSWWLLLEFAAGALAMILFVLGRRQLRAANDELLRLMTNNGIISSPILDEALSREEQAAKQKSALRATMAPPTDSF